MATNQISSLSKIFSSLLLTAALACSPSLGTAQKDELLFESKAEETIRVRLRGDGEEDLHAVVEQQKVDFHHITLWGNAQGAPDRQVIARETLRQVQDHGREGVESNLRVDLFFARDNHGKFPAKPTHTLEIPNAHEAEFEDAFWIATTLGCCDAEPYSRMYTYGSDRPFLRYNEDFWKVEVPNARGLDRYIGIALRAHVPGEAAEEAIFGKEKRAVAAVILASLGKTLHTVYLVPKADVDAENLGLHTEELRVRGTGPKDEQHPDVRLVTLWSMDGAAENAAAVSRVSGLQVEAGVYLDDGTTEVLQLDIRDDKFVNPRVKGSKLNALLPVSPSQ